MGGRGVQRLVAETVYVERETALVVGRITSAISASVIVDAYNSAQVKRAAASARTGVLPSGSSLNSVRLSVISDLLSWL